MIKPEDMYIVAMKLEQKPNWPPYESLSLDEKTYYQSQADNANEKWFKDEEE